MSLRYLLTCCTLFVALTFPWLGLAQIDVSKCAVALTKDFESYARMTSEKLHVIRIIDEKTWREYHQQASGDGSLFGLVKLGGDMQSLKATEKNYSTRRTTRTLATKHSR